MHCWKCRKQIGETPAKIGFRAVCPHCDADLHTCKNCRYYSPGKPNDCLVPGTEFIRDREAANFCEDFKIKLDALASPNNDTLKNKFKSLFKDDEKA